MSTAKQVAEKMDAAANAKFASVMQRIAAISCEADITDELSCDMDNLPASQREAAEEALEAKGRELGLI